MSAIQWRVIWPEDSGGFVPSAAPTLTKCFDEIERDKLFWDSKTAREYRITIRLWAEITGDPPIDALTADHITAFTRGLMARPGRGAPISPNTIRKHLRQLRAIMNATDRPDVRMPKIAFPPARKTAREVWQNDDLRRIADARTTIEPALTRPVDPAAWWRALVILIYNTAWRIGTAMAARWDWIQGNWITVPAEAIKGRRASRRWYLNRHAIRAIETVKQNADPRIFPWSGCALTLQRHRRRILRGIGLSDGPRCGFHRLRRSSLSAIAKINPLVAAITAGHASGDVLAQHYLSDDVIAAVMERLPQPFA
ncbi:MAG: hypothetical protein Kow0040_24590 [Thermogutta sp.]